MSNDALKDVMSRLDELTSFDPAEMADAMVDADLDHTVALKAEISIDDQVDWAKNILSWCVESRFLGMKPYAIQAEILVRLFEDYCPECTDMAYLDNVPVGDSIQQFRNKVVCLEDHVCPDCSKHRGDFREEGKFVNKTELVAVWGQRGGKSAVAAMIVSYQVHIILRLKTPWEAYGLMAGQMLDFVFVATTAGQSERTLWATFKGILKNSRWFKTYEKVCNEYAVTTGLSELVSYKETFIKFSHKYLLIAFGTNNPNTLRGSTRFGGAIDELGLFDNDIDSGRIIGNGPETYTSIDNSLLTLRVAVDSAIEKDKYCTLPVPILINISSPLSMTDPIMSLYRDTINDDRVVRSHLATWEVNPTMKKERMARELARPNGMRDFGARPPITDNPLVDDMSEVEAASKTPLSSESRYYFPIRPILESSHYDLDVKSGKHTLPYASARIEGDISEWDTHDIEEMDLTDLGTYRGLYEDLCAIHPQNRKRILGVDAGLTNNSFSLCAGYPVEGGKRFITDFVAVITPTEGRSVNFSDVYENFILKLIPKLNIHAVIYDRWNSIHMIHDLTVKFGGISSGQTRGEKNKYLREMEILKEDIPFVAEQYSLNVDDAHTLTNRISQGDFLFPKTEIGVMDLLLRGNKPRHNYMWADLLLQICTVRVKGRRLLKPVMGDDDLFRAWANAAYKAMYDPVISDMLLGSASILKEGKGIEAKPRVSYVSMRGSGGGAFSRTTQSSSRYRESSAYDRAYTYHKSAGGK